MTEKEPRGKILIDPQRCKGCGLCIWACPKGRIVLSDQADHRGIRAARFDGDPHCTGCALCAIMCPDVAITVYRGRQSRKQ